MGNKLMKIGSLLREPEDIPKESAPLEKRNKFFRYLGLPPDDYSGLSFTKQELETVMHSMRYLSTGAASAITLLCSGTKCPYKDRCAFWKIEEQRKQADPTYIIGKDLLMKPCLIEVNLLNEWTRLYIEEYDIPETSFTQLNMVRELAEIELLLYRINQYLAKPENASLIQETVVGVDKQGTVLTREEISAAFEARDRLVARKSRLVKLMVGDREGQYKKQAALKEVDNKDGSSQSAELRKQIEKQIQELEKSHKKLKDAQKEEAIDVDFSSPEDIIGTEDPHI